jgi:hypothetical protein
MRAGRTSGGGRRLNGRGGLGSHWVVSPKTAACRFPGRSAKLSASSTARGGGRGHGLRGAVSQRDTFLPPGRAGREQRMWTFTIRPRTPVSHAGNVGRSYAGASRRDAAPCVERAGLRRKTSVLSSRSGCTALVKPTTLRSTKRSIMSLSGWRRTSSSACL